MSFLKIQFNLFITKCFPYFEDYPTFYIPTKLKTETEKIVLSHLNLTSMGQVRDKYEGQVYYDKIYRKLIALYCIEKLTMKKTISYSLIKSNKLINLNQMHVNSKYITLTEFIFGSLPLINIADNYDSLIFCIRDDYKTAYFCGILKKQELTKKANFISTDNRAQRNLKVLTNFKILKSFSDV